MVYDAIIIGGGVIGCAVARELSRYSGNFALLEKDEDLCAGTSKANSAIVHAGFDARPGSLMAKMNVEGNRMMEGISQHLDVPFRRIGALVLCFDENQREKLLDLRNRGIKNGVEDLQVLTREEALALEPALSDGVCAALYAPSSGIICPFSLTLGYGENAAQNGVEFFFEAPATQIQRIDRLYQITTPKGVFTTRAVVNCAGVYADEIHNWVVAEKVKITPRRGEYILCDKQVGTLVSHTLFQLPTALGKGVLVSPTIHGNL
ncbi:MAG: NAD(P)/FAD-dependent oxidoreductase, partial [Oscillospiraceae bacterium]